MNRILSRLGLTALVLVAGSPVLVAQQSSGAIRGRVSDPSGAGKAGVLVSVANPSNGIQRSLQTDKNGNFNMAFLPVGRYDIVYGFQGQTYKAVKTVQLGQETDASFKWPAIQGTVIEVVAVSAAAQAVDTSTAQIGSTIDTETLADLPMVTRDINAAAVLAPGVSIVQGSNVDPTKKSSTYIMTGEGMGRGTNYAVDGADNNSTDVGGYVLPVPIGAVQELQVVTNQFKAEFGRSTDGFFNILTKSGSNDFKGQLDGQYTNQGMRARKTDEGVKGSDGNGVYAATVSGPILKDKLFYMVSVEQTVGEQGPVFSFSPYALSLVPALAGINYDYFKKNVYSKVDWNITSSANLSWTYGYYQDQTANQTFPRTSSYNGNILTSTLGTGKNQTWATGLKLTVVSDALVWESNMHFFNYNNSIRPHDPGPGNGSDLALLDAGTKNSPRPDTNNLGWGGQDPNAYQGTGIERTQWKNDFSWTRGDHNIRAGLDLTHNIYRPTVLFFPEVGVYYMTVAGNGINYVNGWNNTIDPNVNVMQARFIAPNGEQGTTWNQYAVYLQDDWNLSPKASLYLGVRADKDTQLDYLQGFDSMYAQMRANTLKASSTADPDWNSGKAPRGKTYVSPRLQFVFKPNADDSLAYKFGAGQFTAQVIDNVTGFSRGLSLPINGLPNRARNAAAYAVQGNSPGSAYFVAPNFNAGTTIGNVGSHAIVLPYALTPYNYANNVGGLRDYFRNTVAGWLTTATADTDGKSLIASDFEYPQTTAFNVGVAYRLDAQQSMEANVLYSKTTHMTAQVGLDGSGPKVEEYDSSGNSLADAVFYSRQSASSLQLQLKYSYSNSATHFMATIVWKDQKASEGGASGAFDASGATGGLYGEGARFAWQDNPVRRSGGTPSLQGTFNFSHRFSTGTMVSLLGQWHSGMAYDVTSGYSSAPGYGPNSSTDLYHPADLLGYQTGHWAMELDAKVSQLIKFGSKFQVEPYISIQNLLNNYDYGSNFDGQKYLNDGTYNGGTGQHDGFGTRLPSFQSNLPRFFALGVKVQF
jgi:hypothetical protein